MPFWRDITHGFATTIQEATRTYANKARTHQRGFVDLSVMADAVDAVAERVAKATQNPGPPPAPRNVGVMQGQLNLPDAPRSAFLDYLQGNVAGEWREHPLLTGANSYGRIRKAITAMPILGIILKTRADQLAQFAFPAETRYDMGYQILPRDKGTASSPRIEAEQAAIVKYVFNCGLDSPGSVVRDDFPTYIRKVSEDSLKHAQDGTEKVLDRVGRVAQWYAVDGTTLRFAARTNPVWSNDIDNEIRYVQVVNGVAVTAYRWSDLIFGIRNPSTDIRMNGYGTSEIETVMQAVIALIYAFEYNLKQFTAGTSAKGIINIKGEGIGARMIQDFRSMWKMMVSGADNAHTIPVISADNFEFVDLSKSNRDLEYQQYVDFLIKILCSGYAMSPDEINFQYGNVGQQNTLGGQDNRQKIVESRVRGLRPHLQMREHLINTQIIWPRWPQYKLAFTGLDAMTRQEAIDFNTKLVTNTHTVDEVRAMDGLAPLPDGLGENLLNSVYAQLKQGQQNAAMMGQAGDEYAEAPVTDENDPDNSVASSDVENEDDNNTVGSETVNKSWDL